MIKKISYLINRYVDDKKREIALSYFENYLINKQKFEELMLSSVSMSGCACFRTLSIDTLLSDYGYSIINKVKKSNKSKK